MRKIIWHQRKGSFFWFFSKIFFVCIIISDHAILGFLICFRIAFLCSSFFFPLSRIKKTLHILMFCSEYYRFLTSYLKVFFCCTIMKFLFIKHKKEFFLYQSKHFFFVQYRFSLLCCVFFLLSNGANSFL